MEDHPAVVTEVRYYGVYEDAWKIGTPGRGYTQPMDRTDRACRRRKGWYRRPRCCPAPVLVRVGLQFSMNAHRGAMLVDQPFDPVVRPRGH